MPSPRRASRSKDNADNDKRNSKSASPRPSASSWNVDRGRSRVRRPSNPFSEESLRRKGYHSLHSSFGKVFNVERRWSLIRELGSGAYGVVISAADQISGETVAIKLVTRVFDKIQLAKRALREITLLRHFANHENITGLIDVDAISPDFNEIYIFMEPMEADLHQIIKSGQTLTNEHVQYFLYQILRGMKYIHSASVVHRDLKPGNLLVNADCELKICDFGLSRGFDANPVDDEHATHLTEYVATRWYRAPEIMLAFRRYNTAIDVWSIGCILAELLLGRPLFKGKDYGQLYYYCLCLLGYTVTNSYNQYYSVDQLNKILDMLGTPEESVIKRIGSEKAQAYVRSLPIRKKVPFRKVLPMADPLAIDLIAKMLTFDPADRITVAAALQHPWLAAYHDEADEPTCASIFDKWRKVEELETIDDFREALWNEIEEYRREVRGIALTGLPTFKRKKPEEREGETRIVEAQRIPSEDTNEPQETITDTISTAKGEIQESSPLPPTSSTLDSTMPTPDGKKDSGELLAPSKRDMDMIKPSTPTDPVVTYARRSSIMQPQRQQGGSTYNSPMPGPHYTHGGHSQQGSIIVESPVLDESTSLVPPSFTAPGNVIGAGPSGAGGVVFPTQGYVIPARSRTVSTAGAEVPRRLLRTLSTVSIHESAEGLAGGLAGIAPIGKYILEKRSTTDACHSEMPTDLGIEEDTEEEEGGEGEKDSGKKFKVM